MRLSAFLSGLKNALAERYPLEEASAIASRLCEELLEMPRYAPIIDPDIAVPPEKEEALRAASSRLLLGEPLQYVLGYADFLDARLRVTPDVLIPRPETEYLCQRIIRQLASRPPRRILDLCTGSGCIAWSLAKAFPDAIVVGVDVSEKALEIARSQKPFAFGKGTVRTPVFIRGNVLDTKTLAKRLQEELPDEKGFDLLVSNPPYVLEREKAAMKENVLGYEPHLALFVPDEDPLRFYKALSALFFSPLFPGNSLCALEINENFGAETAALFSQNRAHTRIEQDLNEKDRYIFSKKA
ncbi:MAG: peptide chain release factor N(5)-glutamine methyltransferase [Bacteroidales bacterium]|nr:peptide chain release factor N(5)-glutamine methyltransferase [Bacteroidales bacterium]